MDLMIVYFCIRHLETVGAALAVSVTEFVVCGIQVWLSREEHIIPSVLKSFVFLVCGAVMALVISNIHLSDNIILNLTIKMGIGALVYLALAGLYYFTQCNKGQKLI